MPRETGVWMPMYWGDYFGDTMHLTTEEHGAYLLLIGTYWRRAKALPDDDKWLASVAKMSTKRWKMVRPKIIEFFDILDGHLYHKRVEKEIDKSSGRLDSARASGQAGGLAKSKLTTTTTTKKKNPPSSPPKGTVRVTGFDAWWERYPRKVGKEAARRKYRSVVKAGTPEDVLASGLEAYRTKVEAEATEERYIAHPATWLSQGRWQDEGTDDVPSYEGYFDGVDGPGQDGSTPEVSPDRERGGGGGARDPGGGGGLQGAEAEIRARSPDVRGDLAPVVQLAVKRW